MVMLRHLLLAGDALVRTARDQVVPVNVPLDTSTAHRRRLHVIGNQPVPLQNGVRPAGREIGARQDGRGRARHPSGPVLT